jgi:hypothetical protein
MKASALPQAVLAKLVDLDERTSELMTEATEAEARVARAREIVNGKDNNVTPEQFAHARDNFAITHTLATKMRERAEVQRKILAEAKKWIEGLPSDTRLLQVGPASSDLDVTALCAKLAGLRHELRQLVGQPPAAPATGAAIDKLVAGWAEAASPMVRGFHEGGTLDVRWPSSLTGCNRVNGVGFDPESVNPLLMMAALFPNQLSGLILKAIEREQPLSVDEHAERVAALQTAIDEISYVTAMALDKADAPPDPLMCAWHWLGVRVADEIEAVAVA